MAAKSQTSVENEMDGESSLPGEFAYKKHHEDTPAFKDRFSKDVRKFAQALSVNPFDSDAFTAVNNASIVFGEDIANTIRNIDALGEQQFLKFWNERLVQAEVPITAVIPKNNLLSQKTSPITRKLSSKILLTPKMISYLGIRIQNCIS